MTDAARDATTGTGDTTAPGRATGRSPERRSDERSVGGRDADVEEQRHLRRKRAERRGNVERAEVADIHVGDREAVLKLRFDWSETPEPVRYDLDDDRDVLRLEAVAEAHGFDFEQVGHLAGLSTDVTYTGRGWVPTAQLAHEEGEGSLRETFRAELRLLARELARSPNYLRRSVAWVRGLSTQQAILAAVLIKKFLVVAIVAYVLL